MNSEDRLFADLKAMGIVFDLFEHEAVFTVEESHRINQDIPGAHTKNLFLKDTGGQFWLVTVPADKRVDLKSLTAAIGCKRVSFGKADDMIALLGITPGSVTPLAAINDDAGKVAIALDAALSQGRINAHPLRNTGTIGLDATDLIRLLGHWNHSPLIAEIPALEII